MTNYQRDESQKPEFGFFDGFDHIRFFVSNAKQTASFYTSRFGFHRLAFSGMETGDKNYCTQVVGNGKVIFAFTSPYNPNEAEINNWLRQHGDGVREVAFKVDDATAIFNKAVQRGALPVKQPQVLRDDDGTVVISSVMAFGDTLHTFVERTNYNGAFLPGYAPIEEDDLMNSVFESIEYEFIDHIVANMPENEMQPTVEWYINMLDFHRYAMFDDKIIHTEYSALRSTVVSDWDETIKIPVNEPENKVRRSQTQEFVDYFGGPGTQHIALHAQNIIETVRKLRRRGLKFLSIDDGYYDLLKQRLEGANVVIDEDLKELQEQKILVDFDDEGGYLLQIFTETMEDRPTLFIEIIQKKHDHRGFGAGNFKQLFELLELQQTKRGTLDLESFHNQSKQNQESSEAQILKEGDLQYSEYSNSVEEAPLTNNQLVNSFS